MSETSGDVLKPAQLTPTADTQQLIDELPAKVIDPLHQTDHNLDLSIKGNTTLAEAKPDVYVDTTLPVGPVKLNDIWIDTSSNNRINYCNSAYLFGAGVAGDWTTTNDNAATPVNQDNFDFKATTFATVLSDADAQVKHPGPGGETNQTTITGWTDITSTSGDVGAQVGDVWVNIEPSTFLVRIQFCKLKYDGTAGEPGTRAANWHDLSSDEGVKALLALKYSVDGSIALTAPIDFTPVLATQDFEGKDAVLSGAGRIRYGGTAGSPNAIDSVDDAVPHKKYVDDSISTAVSLAIKLDGSNSPSADIGWGANKITNLADGAVAAAGKEVVNGGQLYLIDQDVITAQATADGAVTTANNALPKAGGTMTGQIELTGTPSGNQAAKFNQIPTSSLPTYTAASGSTTGLTTGASTYVHSHTGIGATTGSAAFNITLGARSGSYTTTTDLVLDGYRVGTSVVFVIRSVHKLGGYNASTDIISSGGMGVGSTYTTIQLGLGGGVLALTMQVNANDITFGVDSITGGGYGAVTVASKVAA